jgi:alpha-D-ribose 1-methylphosphonate 5-triphosphate diphosphatase
LFIIESEDTVTPGELTFKNARIVTPTGIVEGTVYVRQGVIADIHGSASASTAIDCEGDYLIPGLIDIHTDNLEHHIKPRTSADWPVMAALVAHDAQMVSAGITTVLDSLAVGVVGYATRTFEAMKKTVAAVAAARQSRILRGDHFLHLRAEISNEGLIEQFAAVHPDPHVLLVSLMDHTPGQRQWRDIEKYIAMEKRDFHLTQEEIDKFLNTAQERHERISGPNRASIISSVEGHAIALASHDDTTVEHVEQAHGEGIAISEFPTTIEAAGAARDKGMKIVAGAPNLVLGRSHSGNVSVEELASRNLLDALASDYVPSSMLQGAFLLAERGTKPLHEAVNLVSLAPARMVGLTDRGSIEIGLRADLVRVKEAAGLPLPLMVWREAVRVA